MAGADCVGRAYESELVVVYLVLLLLIYAVVVVDVLVFVGSTAAELVVEEVVTTLATESVEVVLTVVEALEVVVQSNQMELVSL